MGKFKSKINQNLLKAIGPCLVLLCYSFSTCVAWFSNAQKVDGDNGVNIEGSIQAKYFTGSGTEDDPYYVGSAIQLYYFAWLQNLGYYNVPYEEDDPETPVDETEIIKPVYFKLTTDIDMSSYTLPAIGTTQYPFVGNFNGDGYTISNLTVESNVANMNNVPSAVYESETGYEQYAQIIGFFGVVGSVRGDGKILHNGSTYTYSSSVNRISSFVLDELTVTATQTRDNKLLIGLVAGYVNGTIESVYVNNSSMNISSSKSALSELNSIQTTDRISNYSIVGYCRNAYRKTIDIITTNYRAPSSLSEDDFFYEASGEENQWGGSLSMYNLFQTVTMERSKAGSGASTAYQKGANGANTTTSFTYKHVDNSGDGTYSLNFVGNNYNHTSYLYLGGNDFRTWSYKNTVLNEVTDSNTITAGTSFVIYNSSSGYYSYISGTTSHNRSTSTYSEYTYNSDKTITSTYNGSKRWLCIRTSATGTLYVRTTAQTSNNYNPYWTITSYNGHLLLTGNNGYYLYYSGGFKMTNNASTAANNPAFPYIMEESSEVTYKPDYDYPTYFPLKFSVDSNNYYAGISDFNTGYITSGGNGIGSTSYGLQNTTFGDRSNLRISSYAMTYLKGATGGSVDTYTTGTNYLDIVTRTPDTNGWCIIKDQYNKNVTSNSTYSGYTNGSGLQRYTPEGDGDALTFQKYVKSRKSLESTLNGKSYVYGVHYLTANIAGENWDNFSTATKAVLYTQGESHTYYNYPLPINCINFNLADDGIVNFFIGSYYNSSGQGTLFRMYHINRNSSQQVESIFEISKVYSYQNASGKTMYFYEYDGGSTTYPQYSIDSATVPSNKKLEFDCDWIREPIKSGAPFSGTNQSTATSGLLPNGMFYFEIPINAGEYALGPDKTKEGAYIVYLDIGANAQKITRNTVIQVYDMSEVRYDYPVGVAIVGTSAAVDLTSIGLGLETSFDGEITFSRGDDGKITINSNNTNYVVTYLGNDGYSDLMIGNYVVIQSSQGNSFTQQGIYSKYSKVRQITYYDYNNVQDALYTTNIFITDITENGVTTRYFSYTCIMTQYDGSGGVESITECELPGWFTDIESPSNDENAKVMYDKDTAGNDIPADNNNNIIELKYLCPSIYNKETGEPLLMDVDATYSFDAATSTVYITIDPTQFEDSTYAVENIYIQYTIAAGTTSYKFNINGNTVVGSAGGSTGRITISVDD